MNTITNGVVISDLHCGDQLAIFPPRFKLTHGPIVRQSRFQRFIWERWNFFWDTWVPKVTRGEPFCIIVNGDFLEGRHHCSTHQITQDKSDQAKIAYEIIAPLSDLCKGQLYFVSGTDAHGGQAGEDEESLAKALGGIPHPDSGRYAPYERYIKVGSALCHFSHHIGVTGSMAYETTALTKEFSEFCADCAKWGAPAPDIVVRSHRHRHSEVRVPTRHAYGYIFVTSSWQLKTPFIFRVPGGRTTTPTIGGSLIRQGDEEFFTRHKTWSVERSTTERPKVVVK